VDENRSKMVEQNECLTRGKLNVKVGLLNQLKQKTNLIILWNLNITVS